MTPVFDVHVHIFPDKIAAPTIKALGDEAGISAYFDGTRAALLESMAAAGITGALNCPIATRPDQVASINRWAAAQNRWPVLSFGTVHPDLPDLAGTLRQLNDAGLRGIKLHPEYQDFTLADPRLTVVWETCTGLGLVILLHAGIDLAFPPPSRSDPASIRVLLEAYPRLRFIAAHFGSWRMWDEVETELIGGPAYLDLSFTFGYLADDRLVALSRRHGIDKIVFGTDAPWRSQKQDLEHLRRLSFTAAELRQIEWDNAARLLGLDRARAGGTAGAA